MDSICHTRRCIEHSSVGEHQNLLENITLYNKIWSERGHFKDGLLARKGKAAEYIWPITLVFSYFLSWWLSLIIVQACNSFGRLIQNQTHWYVSVSSEGWSSLLLEKLHLKQAKTSRKSHLTSDTIWCSHTTAVWSKRSRATSEFCSSWNHLGLLPAQLWCGFLVSPRIRQCCLRMSSCCNCVTLSPYYPITNTKASENIKNNLA